MPLRWERVSVLWTLVPGAARALHEPRPVVAVAGASNVGKSSLLNALFQRKKLARTSKSPGCTRAIHGYLVDGRLVIADLPGYGHAQVSKAEQEAWARLIAWFFERIRPRLVVALMDIRHGPKPKDLELVRWLNALGLAWTPVATKADKLSRGRAKARLEEMSKTLGTTPLAVSARTREGLDQLRALLASLVDG